jgi:hypothetical protein
MPPQFPPDLSILSTGVDDNFMIILVFYVVSLGTVFHIPLDPISISTLQQVMGLDLYFAGW